MTFDDALLDAEEKMIKVIEFVKLEFAGVRTGKASPDLVNNLTVSTYGSTMKLRDIAAVTTPDPRLVVIQPWDVGNVEPIRKAIEESKLGIMPLVDGKLIRLQIPPLSEERRRDLVKSVNKMGEEGRVALRAVRRNALDDVKKLQKEGTITEDDLKSGEKEVQKLTDQYNGEIDSLLATKEADLLRV